MTQRKPQVALADTLFDSLWNLPRHIQPKVQAFITKYRRNPDGKGLNREKVQGARNLYSVRIDRQYRGILAAATDAGVVVLLHIDNHDEAYDWARRHRFEISSGSGTLQVYEAQASAELPLLPHRTEPAGFLAHLRDRQLRRLGIPENRIALARAITTEAEYEEVKAQFPPEGQETLYMLLAGYTFTEVLDELALQPEAGAVDTTDIAAALDRPGTQARFWVAEDEEELKRMLHSPQEKWRVFLHPSQRRLVDRPWQGPVRVLGGAGTGKTVVAMHRARWLLAHHARRATDRVLFLTFTANLAANLESNLRALIVSDDDFRRLEVVHLDRWVYRFLRQHDFPQTIVYSAEDERLQEPWTKALQSQAPELALSPRFYRDEWYKVVLAQGVSTREEYLQVRRTGRGTPLTRPQRARIWQVFEAYRAQLRLAGLIEKDEAYRAVRHIIEAQTTPLPYVSVVVDEAQDFGHEALCLIRTLAHAGDSVPDAAANRLFLVGDAHQRIYDRHVVLSRCGIQIRGRSFRLRINYRTSEPILKSAVSVLEGVAVDDLDGGSDTFQGYRSLFGGPEPELRRFASWEQALQEVTAWVETLKTALDCRFDDFCLVARTHSVRNRWAEALHRQGIAVHCLEGKAADNRHQGAVRLATAHRVKGLEFSGVVILDADPERYPLRQALAHAVDKTDRDLRLRQERSLLHVAMSRARRHLMLCTHGDFSPFLAPLQRDLQHTGE